jgi:hypothetical protein
MAYNQTLSTELSTQRPNQKVGALLFFPTVAYIPGKVPVSCELNLFRIRSYKKRTRKPCRIRTYEIAPFNSFRIRTYKKRPGGGVTQC